MSSAKPKRIVPRTVTSTVKWVASCCSWNNLMKGDRARQTIQKETAAAKPML